MSLIFKLWKLQLKQVEKEIKKKLNKEFLFFIEEPCDNCNTYRNSKNY
jgi:hypothetical protein